VSSAAAEWIIAGCEGLRKTVSATAPTDRMAAAQVRLMVEDDVGADPCKDYEWQVVVEDAEVPYSALPPRVAFVLCMRVMKLAVAAGNAKSGSLEVEDVQDMVEVGR